MATRPAGALGATGKLRLSKDAGIAVGSNHTVAGLATNELDVSGYTPGGYDVVWTGLVNAAADKRAIRFDQLIVATDPDPDPFVGGRAYAWWIDNSVDVLCMEVFPADTILSWGIPGDYLDLGVLLGAGSYQDLT
jgi:hypothetical protein